MADWLLRMPHNRNIAGSTLAFIAGHAPCFLSACLISYSLKAKKKGCMCVSMSVYLRPRLGQDCGAHALCAAHAKVDALGGGEGLSWPHQVKEVC